jgi:membrane-associated phospholipid phosphatase
LAAWWTRRTAFSKNRSVDVAVRDVAAPPRRRALDLLLGVYALVALAALLFPHRPRSWPFFAAANLLFSAACLRLPPVRQLQSAVTARWPRLAPFLADWYPLLLLPGLYLELQVLNVAVHGGRYFDATVGEWERALFGGHPSSEWAARLPFLWLSELLHAAYISYYFVLYVPAIIIRRRAGRAALHNTLFTLMLVFVVHYLFFIYFPVQGPRYLFPAPQGGIERGIFYRIAHLVLETGSSQGAAFPSSHVAASAAVAIAVGRHLRRGAVPLALLTLGIAAGAVYGGFHYGVDVTTGLVLGAMIGGLAPGAQRLLDRSSPDARGPAP